ncbi:hypothetical protein KIN20_012077 [Parelaphostrongylus tenuis]|uniref:Uncharacterized protein n=1 Tax=Parelaphostrongylus tenuis TaxID=148309 RepID=A0AAD5QLK6_PARTN|nr:hypothetical protein KIN20_012077 [Parelaphostrongylus tenuis]
MANAATTKLGCAFHVCDASGIRNLSFVCIRVNIGVPLYNIGEPCSGCGGRNNGKCISNALCNNTGLYGQ